MAEMYLHNHKVNSIFQLLGEHENDISYSVAWALAQCPSFLLEFLQKIGSPPANTNTVQIRLQHHETNGGITDIEIESSGRFYVIVEAKRGWNLPDRRQLEKYVARRSFKKSKAPFKRLMVKDRRPVAIALGRAATVEEDKGHCLTLHSAVVLFSL